MRYRQYVYNLIPAKIHSTPYLLFLLYSINNLFVGKLKYSATAKQPVFKAQLGNSPLLAKSKKARCSGPVYRKEVVQMAKCRY